MTTLTAAQKTSLRSDGHKSEFYLSIVKPAVLLSAQVVAAQDRGAITIYYDNGTGTPSLIREGMTLKVVNDYGTFQTRVTAITYGGSSPTISGNITVDPNSIVWPADGAITIEDMFDPRIIPPEFDSSTGVSKKRSQTFSSQTAQPGPLLKMGGHKAGFVIEGKSISQRITAGADDGYYLNGYPGGTYISNSALMHIGKFSSFSAYAALRWAEVAIPAGATILSANISMVAESMIGTAAVMIRGDKQINPATITSISDYGARTRTTAAVNWTISSDWTAGTIYTTPGLTAVIQELIDQSGWASGNAIQLFIEDNGLAHSRIITSYENSPDTCALLEITYTVPLTFDLTATGVPVAPGASIASYLWACPAGGTIADPNAQNTTITFDTPGGYWVYCTVTDSNGKTLTGVRYYWAASSDPEDTDYPYVDFVPSQIPNSFDGGGNFTVTVNGVADFTEFRDGALVAIWRRAWYGAEEGPISLITGSENIVALGYIIKDTITVDRQHGQVAFEVQTPVNLLKSLPLQALSIHAEQTLQYWFQTNQYMTLIMALQWLLYWHSNVLEVMEWDIPTGGLYKKLFSFNEGSLFAQAQDLAAKFDDSRIGGDKAGRIFVEPHINKMTQADKDAIATVTELTTTDWRDKMVVIRRHQRQTPAVSGKGYYYDGANQLLPYCSVAPTNVRETVGSSVGGMDGMVVADQNHINRLTGLQLALDNRVIEEIRLSLAGDYSFIDVFPQQWYEITLAAGDTPRGIAETIRLVPRSITQTLDPKNGMLLVDAVFEPETTGPDGIYDQCPTEGTTSTSGTSSPLQKVVASATLGGSAWAPSALGSFASLRYLLEGGTAWTAYDASFAANDGSLDPFWKIKQKSSDLSQAIYWLVGAEGTIRQVIGESGKMDRNIGTNPPNSWSDATAPTAATVSLTRIESSIFSGNVHYVAANWQNASLEWRAWIAKTTNNFASVTWYTLFEAGDTQTSLLSLAEDGQDGSRLWLTCWRNGTVYLERWQTSDMTRDLSVSLGTATLTAAGDLVVEVAAAPGDLNTVVVYGLMTSPAGLTGAKHVIRSKDGGTTWESLMSSWGTDACGALRIGPPAIDGDITRRIYYAARNATSSTGDGWGTALDLRVGDYVAVAQMSSSRALVICTTLSTSTPARRGYVILVDTSSDPPVVLEEFTIPTADGLSYVSISRIDDTHAVIGYCVTGNSVKVHVVALTGTSLDTFTIGAVASITVSATSTTVASLSATKGVLTYRNATSKDGMGAVLDFDLAADTVTINAVQTFDSGEVLYPCCGKADSTSALVVYKDATDDLLYGIVLDDIGTAWTAGTKTAIEGTDTVLDGGSENGQYLAYVSDGILAVAYQVKILSNYRIAMRTLSVTGAAVSPGSRTVVSTTAYDSSPVMCVNNGVAQYMYQDATNDLIFNDTIFAALVAGTLDYALSSNGGLVAVYQDADDSSMLKLKTGTALQSVKFYTGVETLSYASDPPIEKIAAHGMALNLIDGRIALGTAGTATPVVVVGSADEEFATWDDWSEDHPTGALTGLVWVTG